MTANDIFNLESLLQQLIVEHRKLLRHVEAYQNAMKKIDLDAMDQAARQQEASRLRIAALEAQRRGIVTQLAKQHRLAGEVTIARLADSIPDRKQSLLSLRDELRKTSITSTTPTAYQSMRRWDSRCCEAITKASGTSSTMMVAR